MDKNGQPDPKAKDTVARLESQVATLMALVAELQKRVTILEHQVASKPVPPYGPSREPFQVRLPEFPPAPARESVPAGPQA